MKSAFDVGRSLVFENDRNRLYSWRNWWWIVNVATLHERRCNANESWQHNTCWQTWWWWWSDHDKTWDEWRREWESKKLIVGQETQFPSLSVSTRIVWISLSWSSSWLSSCWVSHLKIVCQVKHDVSIYSSQAIWDHKFVMWLPHFLWIMDRECTALLLKLQLLCSSLYPRVVNISLQQHNSLVRTA